MQQIQTNDTTLISNLDDNTGQISPMEKIKVVYIGGVGRSGSTLIDLLAGQADGFFSVGEIIWIWQRNFQENQLVASGEPFLESPFWHKVIEEAFGSFGAVNPVKIEALRKDVERVRHVMRIWMHEKGMRQLNPEYHAKLREYQAYTAKLYRAIQKVSGCDYILDSSKHPTHAFVLQTMDEIDLYTLHLIRDSRAVAHSWQRKKLRPEVHWKTEYMPQFSIGWSIKDWYSGNVLMSLMSSISEHYDRLRYEDFVKDPETGLNKIWSLIDRPNHTIDELKERYQNSANEDFSLSGNPIRFDQKREIKIRLDKEWREKMPTGQKLTVTAATLPLLIRYGYTPW